MVSVTSAVQELFLFDFLINFFDKSVYLQTDGGPIGLELTGAVSRVFMLWWDREFQKQIKLIMKDIDWNIEFYMRYVDDCNCIAKELPPGARIENGKCVIKEDKIEEDLKIAGDQRTATIVQNIANNICEFIQIDTDFPSAHNNNSMPILDLEVMVKNNKILYQHYRKGMANFMVLMAKSAMPMKMKRVCMVQEVIRIMRNTCSDLEDKAKYFLAELMIRMKESGYLEKVRIDVIKSGVKGFENQ